MFPLLHCAGVKFKAKCFLECCGIFLVASLACFGCDANDSSNDTPGGGAGAPNVGQCAAIPGALFCDDFESYAAGPAVRANGWSPTTSSGTLTFDAVHAQGKQALHVHTEGNGRAYIQLSPFTPPANSFFGRMRVWVDAFPVAPNYAHFTLVELAGTGAGLIRPIGGQFIDSQSLWGTGSDQGPTGDWTNWRTSTPTQNARWICLEWELAAANNAINVWIDGVAKPELSVTTTTHGGSNVDFVLPTFNSIWFGWWLYQSGPTPNQYDVWLDDLALSTQKIGCQ